MMLYDEEVVVVVVFMLSMSHLSCQIHMHFKVMGVYARHVYYDINDDK